MQRLIDQIKEEEPSILSDMLAIFIIWNWILINT